MSYVGLIGSAIYQRSGVPPEDLPEGTVLDLSLRSLESLDGPDLYKLAELGMIRKTDIKNILIGDPTKGFPKITITGKFKKEYDNYINEETGSDITAR